MTGSTLRVCARYHTDGTACTNATANADGWCRQPDCPGFIRPDPASAPPAEGPPSGTTAHVAATAGVVVNLDVDEVDQVQITQTAIDSFRFHHGGSEAAARAELVVMVEDFVRVSARRPTGTGYLRLSRSGYTIVLSDDHQAVTGYQTVHRERTWSQVRAGVHSRFRAGTHRGPDELAGTPPERGPALEPDRVPGAVDPATVHLTVRSRSTFERALGLRGAGHHVVTEAMRAALGDLATGTVVSADGERGVVVAAAGLAWRVAPDARAIIAVAPHP